MLANGGLLSPRIGGLLSPRMGGLVSSRMGGLVSSRIGGLVSPRIGGLVVSVRRSTSSLSWFPVVRQQIFYRIDWMILDTIEHIGEVFQGVDVANFAGSQDGIKDSGSLGGIVRTCEQIVLPPQGDWPDGIFYQVIIDFQSSIAGIYAKFVPTPEAIGNSFADGTFGQNFHQIGFEPKAQFFQDGYCFRLPQRQSRASIDP